MERRFYNILSETGLKIGSVAIDDEKGVIVLPGLLTDCSLRLERDKSLDCGHECEAKTNLIFTKG